MSSSQKRTDKLALEYLKVEGFKSLRDATEAELRPLTILAGNNSSGKSSLMQPLLLLKQTFDAPYDPGPLLLDGPNVAFSDVQQLFWYAPGGSRNRSFTVVLQRKPENSLTITFRRATGKTKRQPESVHLAECVWKFGQETLQLRPDMSKEEIEEAATIVLHPVVIGKIKDCSFAKVGVLYLENGCKDVDLTSYR
mgnify:CR=1 FL=1